MSQSNNTTSVDSTTAVQLDNTYTNIDTNTNSNTTSDIHTAADDNVKQLITDYIKTLRSNKSKQSIAIIPYVDMIDSNTNRDENNNNNDILLRTLTSSNEHNDTILKYKTIQVKKTNVDGNQKRNTQSSNTTVYVNNKHNENIQHVKVDTSSLLTEQETELQHRINDVNNTIATLEQQDKLKKQYYNKLHEFNNIKDFVQNLLGKLAELSQKSLVDVHKEYGLSLKE